MIKIRQENKNDYQEVYNLIKTAFKTAKHSDGNEQDLVVNLRKSNNFIPKLSLVAKKENEIIGYILFTKIKIGEHEELALAPLGVLPKYQKQGVGSMLIKEGHRIAKNLKYHYSVVLGDPKYYSKFGYSLASKYGVKPPFDVPDENFMIAKLNDADVEIKGLVKYAKEFGV